MIDKLKQFFGLDDYQEVQVQSNSLIDMASLHRENQELVRQLRMKDQMLNELSDKNLSLIRENQILTDRYYSQCNVIDIYEQAGKGVGQKVV